MQLPTWLSKLLTPPQRIRTWLEALLRPPAPPDDEYASEELPDATEDDLPPSRLREILALPAVREQAAEEEAEEGLAPPSRLREILARSSALGARLAPPDRLRQLLQPRTRLQASLLAGIAITAGLGLSFYLGALVALFVAGSWGAIWSWRYRMGLAHSAALAVVFWMLVLASDQVLQRTGYAAVSASWVCGSR